MRSFSFGISPRGFLVCLSLQIASFYSAAVASRIRRATVLQHIESQSIQIRNFCFKSFFVIFSTKSSAIYCIMFSIEISPLVSVLPNSYFNTLELISIFFSLKTPQLFYTIHILYCDQGHPRRAVKRLKEHSLSMQKSVRKLLAASQRNCKAHCVEAQDIYSVLAEDM